MRSQMLAPAIDMNSPLYFRTTATGRAAIIRLAPMRAVND
jgi:hypothetical protein